MLATVAFTMSAPSGRVGLLVAFALQAAVLLLALRVADAPPRLARTGQWAAAGVVAVGIGADISGVGGRSQLLAILGALLTATAVAAIVYRLAVRAREEGGVDGATVLGAICVYLLIGTLFTFAFGAVAASGEQFFASGERPSLASVQYFSFTTLTTVGYGDLAPVTRLGRSLAMIEALVGQVYLVTIVALLVGRLGTKRGTGWP